VRRFAARLPRPTRCSHSRPVIKNVERAGLSIGSLEPPHGPDVGQKEEGRSTGRGRSWRVPSSFQSGPIVADAAKPCRRPGGSLRSRTIPDCGYLNAPPAVRQPRVWSRHGPPGGGRHPRLMQNEPTRPGDKRVGEQEACRRAGLATSRLGNEQTWQGADLPTSRLSGTQTWGKLAWGKLASKRLAPHRTAPR
jgi:hypothetical protein